MKCCGKRRYGGTFSMGKPRWESCKGTPTVLLLVPSISKKPMPACNQCWKELLRHNIHIQQAMPITEERDEG